MLGVNKNINIVTGCNASAEKILISCAISRPSENCYIEKLSGDLSL